MEDKKIITINIPVGMYDWLERHKNINRSQLFRDAVEAKRHNVKQQKQISPLMYLISIMGIVFSVALIGIAITPTPIHTSARALLSLLGGILAIATSVLYYKEYKEKKENNNGV